MLEISVYRFEIKYKEMKENVEEVTTTTTYALADLEESIPLANFDDIKKISSRMQEEQQFYNNREYHRLLNLLSSRLIQVSRQRRAV